MICSQGFHNVCAEHSATIHFNARAGTHAEEAMELTNRTALSRYSRTKNSDYSRHACFSFVLEDRQVCANGHARHAKGERKWPSKSVLRYGSSPVLRENSAFILSHQEKRTQREACSRQLNMEVPHSELYDDALRFFSYLTILAREAKSEILERDHNTTMGTPRCHGRCTFSNGLSSELSLPSSAACFSHPHFVEHVKCRACYRRVCNRRSSSRRS